MNNHSLENISGKWCVFASIGRVFYIPVFFVSYLFTPFAMAAVCPYNECNLKVYGVVTATSCDIDVGSQVINVDLGNMSIGSFRNVGDVSPTKKFLIKLKDCSPGITGGKIQFQGTSDSNNVNLLQITQQAGSALGVGVEILDAESGVTIPLNTAVNTKKLESGDNELSYALRYKSTLPSVSAGTANAIMYFDLNYQ